MASLDAEVAVLGAILQDTEALRKAVALLHADDFATEGHRKIFGAARALFERNEPVDLVTTTEELRRREDLQTVGGPAALAALVEAVPSAANVAYHARLVREAGLKRRIAQEAAELAEQARDGGDLPTLQGRIERLVEVTRAAAGREGGAGPERWEVLDGADHREWRVVRPPWLVHPIIAAGTIGYIAGLPKVGKSLTVLDLLLHEAHGQDWLGRFAVAKPGPTVLYVAREDPAWRLQERIREIQDAYGFPDLPRGRLLILSRERFNLTEEAHVAWLRRTVQERGVGLLVLDVLGRMLRGLDPMREADWGRAQDILEELNRDLGLTIALLDHARKPPLGKGKAGAATPVDLKGPVERYGGADWMVVLAETDHPGRLEVYGESKDSDRRPYFIIEIAPMGTGGPKIRWVADVDRLAKGSRKKGEANRGDVLAVFRPGDRLQAAEIIRRYREAGGKIDDRSVKRHLAWLAGSTPARLVREGENADVTYRLADGVTMTDESGTCHGSAQALPF